ncbi:Response regulator receiver domain-containing protein [Lachnospiraceae bacterium XBB1006]|nr:Response regulator receiver domain-containing protein [Lachnospiraceae bacterium XBB1006]
MKKILFVGKMNEVMKDINAFLEKSFQMQLCSDDRETLAGLLSVSTPDLVLVSLIGMQDVNTGIFNELANKQIPVLTIGTEGERQRFLKYYEGDQFENLVRPLENSQVREAIARRLHLSVDGLDEEEVVASDKKRILVIDDEATTLRSIKGMLEQDYEVMIAPSGVKAMTMMGKKRPDLILLDYEMPVCDGKQTLEMIKSEEELKDIPVIFLTSVNDREHIEAVLRLLPAGYMLKPASKTKLIEAISKAL